MKRAREKTLVPKSSKKPKVLSLPKDVAQTHNLYMITRAGPILHKYMSSMNCVLTKTLARFQFKQEEMIGFGCSGPIGAGLKLSPKQMKVEQYWCVKEGFCMALDLATLCSAFQCQSDEPMLITCTIGSTFLQVRSTGEDGHLKRDRIIHSQPYEWSPEDMWEVSFNALHSLVVDCPWLSRSFSGLREGAPENYIYLCFEPPYLDLYCTDDARDRLLAKGQEEQEQEQDSAQVQEKKKMCPPKTIECNAKLFKQVLSALHFLHRKKEENWVMVEINHNFCLRFCREEEASTGGLTLYLTGAPISESL